MRERTDMEIEEMGTARDLERDDIDFKLPPLPDTVIAELRKARGYPHALEIALEGREDMLAAALAEIERLKSELFTQQDINEAFAAGRGTVSVASRRLDSSQRAFDRCEGAKP